MMEATSATEMEKATRTTVILNNTQSIFHDSVEVCVVSLSWDADSAMDKGVKWKSDTGGRWGEKTSNNGIVFRYILYPWHA